MFLYRVCFDSLLETDFPKHGRERVKDLRYLENEQLCLGGRGAGVGEQRLLGLDGPCI